MIKRVLSKLRKVTMSLFAVLCAGAVWAEEGEVTTPEVTPEPEPTPSTSALALDPSAGYILTGLGELGDQAVVVFTNSAAAVNWTVPRNLKNVEMLVVGGGGGGGGHYYNSTAKNCQGGAGGGAGAVVTGFIKDLAADQVVNVTVGAGGAGGAATTSATTGAGKGGNGGNSIIKVGDVTYVTAYGGGGDGGYNSAGVANGGSNSGVRGTKTAANLKSVTVVGEGAENLVSDIVARANKGGGPYTTSSGYPGAGGGGADSAGHPTYGGSSCGGTGGFGYVSYITGERVVYGAGGGGGIGKNGGDATYLEDDWIPLLEGAGLGKAGQAGSNALANQGAGGGGGSWKQKGGNGGSGIVVLRFGYSDVDIPVDATENIITKISNKPYTGSALVSGLENTYAYTVEELGERINVGQQTVRVTLNDGYVWADGDTNKSKDFTWNITQEANNWKVEPYLSHTAWPDNFASSVNFKFTAPQTSFGVLQAELSANGAAPQPFSGTLPTEPGSYTLKYWVEGTANWAAKEWTVNFKIYQSEVFAEGYKVYGLGENGDEVAVVFTKSATWTVPANLKSAQFLVVGGGGGGGADSHDDAASGGAGGGGGGVVTGEVDLTKDAAVTVTVGAGGAGGTMRTSQADGESGTFYGASKKGGNSVLKVAGTTYVTAYGGGRDRGTTKRDSSTMATSNMNTAGQGGSNAGSRGGITTAQSTNPTKGAVASNAALRNCTTYGNKGGKGCSENFYGFPAAGGGGGATEAGGDAGNNAAGWPGGKGGEGLASDITGARLVYGSGGGGASTQGALGGVGGSGAGNGGDREDAQGTSALANQGGGGGGTSRAITSGGAGGSGIVVIRYSVYAAEVDGVPYATLADAFAAAEAGATVKLLNDVTLAEKITVKKAVTLDLNGCTLSETVTDSYGAFYVGTAGNLTITDSATGGKIATDGGIVVGNYGTVTVAGGTIEAGAVAEDDTSVYNFYYNGSTYGKLTVTGGKLGRIWNCGNANVTAGEVVDIDNSGAMTIADAAIISDDEILLNNDAPEVPNAGTIITDKELNVITTVADYVVEKVDGVYKLKYTKTYTVTLPAAPANTVWYYNGQAVTGPIYAVYGSNVTITLKPAQDCFFSDGAAELTVIEISAIGEDTTVTLDNVTVPEAFQVVAKIGDTPYASLQAAYAAAEAESTIVLCKDVTGAGLVIDKSVTIDFGGNTYTFNDGVGNVPSNGFQILNGNTVTLKNGELNVDAGSADKFYTLIQNYANLTVEDMVLDGTNLDKWSKTDGDSYVLSNNSGTVLIQGATSITANDDGELAYAFDVCKYKTYDAPTVTLNTTGTIAGKVEVSGGDFVYENGTITGGINFTAGSVTGVEEDDLAIPEDKNLAEDEDGAFILVDKVYAAQVGEQKFETFAEALAAANGNAIMLLADVEADFEVAGAVEINLNGFDVKCSVTLTAVDSTLTAGAELPNATMIAGRSGYNVSYADGVYNLAKINVAMIEGGDTYGTLAAALADAAVDATVKLIADTEETVTIPADFTGTIDLNGFTLEGRIDSYATGAVLKNGSVIHTTGSKAAIQIEAGSLELTDINMESNYHGVRLNGVGTTATINSGTYRITSSAGTYNLIYASKANAKFYVYGGEFYNNGDTGSTWVLKSYASGSEINVYGGTFSAYSANTFEVANGGVIKVFGGTFTGCNPSVNTHATVQPGYAVEGTGPWTVVASWTAPMPDLEEGDSFSGDYEYTSEVLSALEAKAATSVDVKVNGVELKGDEAIKALNTAVASFDDALTFDGTAASVDIVIEVTEVNTEDPAASTVVVKRGETVLSVKTGIMPTVKYFYPDTKEWKADKPESGAVLFKIVY